MSALDERSVDILLAAVAKAEEFIGESGPRLARIEDRLGEVVAALDHMVERLAVASCAREDQTAALGSLALDDAERAGDAGDEAKAGLDLASLPPSRWMEEEL